MTRATTETPLKKRIKRHVVGRKRQFFAATAPGLETICRKELKALLPSGTPMAIVEGGVEFKGRLHHCYLANMNLRTANRVVLGTGKDIKVRPIRLSGGVLSMFRIYELLAADDDVKGVTSSTGFRDVQDFAGDATSTWSNALRTNLARRVRQMVARGTIYFRAACNVNPRNEPRRRAVFTLEQGDGFGIGRDQITQLLDPLVAAVRIVRVGVVAERVDQVQFALGLGVVEDRVDPGVLHPGHGETNHLAFRLVLADYFGRAD